MGTVNGVLPAKRQNKLEEEAAKSIKRAVAWLLKNALLKGGVPQPFAGPLSKYYDEHVRIFMKLIVIQLKNKPVWHEIRTNEQEIRKQITNVERIILKTEVPDLGGIKRWWAIAPFLGEEAVAAAREEQVKVVSGIEQVVHSLNVQLDQIAAVAALTEKRIDHIRQLMNVNTSRDTLEVVFGSGSLAAGQYDLCVATTALLSVGRRLEQHRNDWAELIGWPETRLNQNIDRWEKKCEVPF